MADHTFVSGDRVRHNGRPEWGIGTIVKAEQLPLNGKPSQRLSIRFPNAGIKTIVTGIAPLELANGDADPYESSNGSSVQAWDKMKEADWLAPVASRKIEEAMISLPADARDGFNSLQKRLTVTMALYRFDRSSKGLMDWAVAQTGLDDPLSRFSRQELEQKFERWAYERDSHLAKLLQEAKTAAAGGEGNLIAAALKSAPATAQDTVRRLIATR